MNQNQSIVYALFKQDDKLRNEYHIFLNASIDASRFLLWKGLHFRDRSCKQEDMFREILKWRFRKRINIGDVKARTW